MDCTTVVSLAEQLLDAIHDRSAFLESLEVDKPASDDPADLARHQNGMNAIEAIMDILDDAHADICLVQESCAGLDEFIGMHPNPWDADGQTTTGDLLDAWTAAMIERRRIVAKEFSDAIRSASPAARP